MSDVKVQELTRKGEQTRAQILETALRLFAARGYQATTMREIAGEAGCSLGLTYRYFARKEELILAFYRQCAAELEEEVAGLPAGPLWKRLERTLRADIARIAPYRDAFGALFGVALAPESELGVFGDAVADVRERVWNVYLSVCTGATDAPREKQARELATVFYGGHLSLVLFWLQDRSPGQRSSDELIDWIAETVKRTRPLLGLPPVSRMLARLARIVSPMFAPRG